MFGVVTSSGSWRNAALRQDWRNYGAWPPSLTLKLGSIAGLRYVRHLSVMAGLIRA